MSFVFKKGDIVRFKEFYKIFTPEANKSRAVVVSRVSDRNHNIRVEWMDSAKGRQTDGWYMTTRFEHDLNGIQHLKRRHKL